MVNIGRERALQVLFVIHTRRPPMSTCVPYSSCPPMCCAHVGSTPALPYQDRVALAPKGE